MWTSSRPTSMAAASWMRLSLCSELSQAAAVSVLANRWRMTQSACAGGLGGITVCLMKPGNCATVPLVSSCQRAKAFHALRTHPRLRDDGNGALGAAVGSGRCVAGRALASTHGCSASLPKMRSGVNGRCGKRTPVAFASAFAMAGATGLMAHSPCDFAPSGPIES